MKNVRFGAFVLILAGGVALAVGSLLAQGTERRFEFEPGQRARILALDGRGSQIGVMVEDADNGVRIQDVDRDSPAEKAGLKEGDVVTEFDGERVRSARQLTRLIQETASGRSVKITVLRSGQRQTFDVTPDSRSMAWGFDSDQIGRDFARGLREIEPQFRELEPRFRRELEPRLREFRMNPPGFFDFRELFPLNPRSRLGIQGDTLTSQLAEYFGVKDGGVLVTSVTKDSAAETAGLEAGDVITSINGDRVRDYDDLLNELRDKTGELTIGIVRDKKEMTLKATLEDGRRSLRPAV